MALCVSILVSIWMHLEVMFYLGGIDMFDCFNPSFYLDASGRQMSLSVLKNLVCFNPSFYLDASGRPVAYAVDPETAGCFNPSFYLDASGRNL